MSQIIGTFFPSFVPPPPPFSRAAEVSFISSVYANQLYRWKLWAVYRMLCRKFQHPQRIDGMERLSSEGNRTAARFHRHFQLSIGIIIKLLRWLSIRDYVEFRYGAEDIWTSTSVFNFQLRRLLEIVFIRWNERNETIFCDRRAM